MTKLRQHYSIDRRIEIDAAHRVPLHGSKCANIHGHRYVIEAICRSETLHVAGEQQGMVLDFGFLKEEMIREIHNHCDHACIMSIDDPMLKQIFPQEIFYTILECIHTSGSCDIVKDFWKIYVMEGPPTAEVLAEHWFRRLEPKITERSEGRAQLDAVRVHETPNCSAIFAPKRPKKVVAEDLVHAEDLFQVESKPTEEVATS